MSNEIRDEVLKALKQVAPELDEASLDPAADFRDELGIDSMDYLNFVIGLHEALKVDIPERDYPKLSSLDACVEYLSARAPVA